MDREPNYGTIGIAAILGIGVLVWIVAMTF